MEYQKLTHSILDANSIIDSIQRAQERFMSFWLSKGLSINDINVLDELENNEDSYNTSYGYYMPRRSQLECGMISLDEVMMAIERYKQEKDGWMHSKYVVKSKSVLSYISREKGQLEEYWTNEGLTLDEVDCLIQMEIDEDVERGSKSYYLSRKWLYSKGFVSLEDIRSDIERWRRINVFRLEWIG